MYLYHVRMKNWAMTLFFSFFSIKFYYFMETIYFKDTFNHWELLEANRHQKNYWKSMMHQSPKQLASGRGCRGEGDARERDLQSIQCPGEGGAAEAQFWEAGWDFNLDYAFPSFSTPSGSPSLNVCTHPYFWRVWKPAQFTLRSACVE